jgi:hypothetical protein
MQVSFRLWKLSFSISIDRLKAEKKRRGRKLNQEMDPNLVHQYPNVAWETTTYMSVRK